MPKLVALPREQMEASPGEQIGSVIFGQKRMFSGSEILPMIGVFDVGDCFYVDAGKKVDLGRELSNDGCS